MKGQPRARAVSIGGRARLYNPKHADTWKALIQVKLEDAKAALQSGPVAVDLEVVMRRPKSHPKRNPPLWVTTKPDVDNVIKAVLDACTGILWHDDAQASDVRMRKRYTLAGEEPGMRMRVGVPEMEHPQGCEVGG